MVQLGPSCTTTVDIHDIEAIEIARPTMPDAPDLRHPAQRLPLPPADRLPTRPEGMAASGLHLDKGNEDSPAYHQIQLIASDAKPMGLDAPAGIAEMDDGQLLSLQAESVARVHPVVG